VIEDRAPPVLFCLGDSPLRQGGGESIQIDFDDPLFQGKGVMVLENLFTQGIPENPEGLSNGVAPLLPVGLRPEEVGEVIPGNGGSMASDVDEESQGLPQGEGSRVALPIQKVRGAEDTELIGQKNLRLDAGTSEVRSLPVPGGWGGRRSGMSPLKFR
jgi:hypothetical protein